MISQSRNRYTEMFRIAFDSDFFQISKFLLATALRVRWACRLNFRGIELLVRSNTPDLRVVRSIMLGEFDEAVKHVRPKYGLILDAGGYIGVSAIAFAKQFPKSKIVVLEPSDENYRLAIQNCRTYPNIVVIKAALARTEGKVELHDRGTGPWGFTIVERSGSVTCSKVADVPSITINNVLSRFQSDGIDLLKLDIEGGEYALLRDGPDWVKSCGVIVAELHDRICAGSTEAFEYATRGRLPLPVKGEKAISVLSP